MVNFFRAAAASVLALASAVQAAAVVGRAPQRQGNALSSGYNGNIEVKSTSPLQIRYSTSSPDDKNWIGIYSALGGGPDNQSHDQNALKWKYTPGLSGVAEIDTDGLAGGEYKAYFLARDGYSWQAAPVEFTLNKSYGGTLKVTPGYPIKVEYSTDSPNAHNWVGIYFAAGGGPDNGTITSGDSNSIRWQYAPDAQGSFEISTDGLGDGVYKAFLLANDQYQSLATPQIFSLGNAVFHGVIAVDYGRTQFTFRYTTQQPADNNWIGIYPKGQGPDSQSQVQGSLAWDWAKEQRGSLTVPGDKLANGEYQAYLLAKGGYSWLASPVTIHKG